MSREEELEQFKSKTVQDMKNYLSDNLSKIMALLLDTDDKIKIALDENPEDIGLKMILEKRLAFFKELNHRDDDNAIVVLDYGNDVPEESVKDNEEINREKNVKKVVDQDVDKPEDVEKESEFGNNELVNNELVSLYIGLHLKMLASHYEYNTQSVDMQFDEITVQDDVDKRTDENKQLENDLNDEPIDNGIKLVNDLTQILSTKVDMQIGLPTVIRNDDGQTAIATKNDKQISVQSKCFHGILDICSLVLNHEEKYKEKNSGGGDIYWYSGTVNSMKYSRIPLHKVPTAARTIGAAKPTFSISLLQLVLLGLMLLTPLQLVLLGLKLPGFLQVNAAKPSAVSAARVNADNPYAVSAARVKVARLSAGNPQQALKDKGVIDSEYFKLPDASQVLLRVPRENNMYNVNLKNIIPSGDLTCLFAKATLDESNLWHRRLRVILPTSVSRPQLKSNHMEDRIMLNNSQGKKHEVENHRRHVNFSSNKTFVTACNDNLNARTSNVNFVCVTCGKCVLKDKHDMCVLHSLNSVNSRTKMLMAVPISTRESKRTVNQSVAKPLRRTVASESTNQKPRHITRKLYEHLVEIILFIIDSGCSKHMTGNLKLLINFVEKFLGSVKFRNDPIAPILGYGDVVQGTVTIKRVYYVEGLNHNLFSVGQFCDADFEVTFWKSTCYIRDLKGNDLLIGYSTQSRAYRVFNKRTRVLVETIHVNFDKLPQMASSDHVSSNPVPQCPMTALEHDSLSPGPQSQENVPHAAGIVTTSNELDLLFSPMFDELLNGSAQVVSKSSTVTTDDAPNNCLQQHITPLNTQTTPDLTCLDPTQAPTVTSTENINQAETILENAQVKDDEFINIFCTPVQDRGETSSRH
nr:hypothetical protein [Tanacetum cinerariifolium]